MSAIHLGRRRVLASSGIWRVTALAALLLLLPIGERSAAPSGARSILVVVLDTTRYDAVSANGRVRGTTPAFDSLAARGVRFTKAYAQANWTVPSHASLFTGLLPHQHGVVGYRSRLPAGIPTLAERLAGAGYETIGVSENPWVNQPSGLARGFERFKVVLTPDADDPGVEVRNAIASWLGRRHDDRPFFLFVNLMDAHWPYRVRRGNRFLPSGFDAAAAAAAVLRLPGEYCRPQAPRTAALLRGLYLGGVAAADAKLAAILRQMREAGLADGLVTIVTADHGEHLGEHRLVLHNFGVRDQLIHVPLVVHGLAGVSPSVVGNPVELVDVVPSLLRWAGLAVPADLPGRPLPTADSPEAVPRTVLSEYTELEGREEPFRLPQPVARFVPNRDACGPADRLYGDMYALLRFPLKLIRYADGSTELFDVATDPGETRDEAARQPAVIQELLEELRGIVGGPPSEAPAPEWTPPPDLLERLRALGYVSGPPR